MKRSQQFEQLEHEPHFDVVVLGGGINGACLYDTLCRRGYKVLLVDKRDFASGTSQASGMMIWGGLLYLRNLDLRSAFQLSADRDRIICDKADWMAPTMMRYLPSAGMGRAKWWVQSGLWFYWLLGMGRRRAPRSELLFSELDMIKPGMVSGSLAYEEAFLAQSDARFVYHWIASRRAEGQLALNYCDVGGEYFDTDKRWHFQITDSISGKSHEVRSTMVINCTGVWTDQVNASFGITSPFRHAFSKGVYLGLPREEKHQSSLFFDLGEHHDVITHVPWGPISLWGPTETALQEIESGIHASSEDVNYLLEHYNRRYCKALGKDDVVSIRCGIRPLVVDKHYRNDRYPLDLSRRQEVVRDNYVPWISCYGGKLTGCTRMADRVVKLIEKSVVPAGTVPALSQQYVPQPDRISFPGLAQQVVSPLWSAEYEMCCTLEDYLRRRTNIAQWVVRGGFGRDDRNAATLKNIAFQIAQGDPALAQRLFENYRNDVNTSLKALSQTQRQLDQQTEIV